VVTGRVRYGGFAKPTSHHRGPDDRRKNGPAELPQKSGDSDFLRAVAESVLQILVEADVEGLIGARRHERTGDRLNYHNGYRERSLDTRLGSLQLRIPKLRQGS
jgi:putative transposase